jgi:hypothetical protein
LVTNLGELDFLAPFFSLPLQLANRTPVASEYLREAAEQKGQKISPFNEFCQQWLIFFLCRIVFETCSFMRIILVYVT